MDLLFEALLNHFAAGLFLQDDLTAPLELLPNELDGAFQHEAFGAALALESWHQHTQTVEAVTDGLPSLLLCRAWLAAPGAAQHGRGTRA